MGKEAVECWFSNKRRQYKRQLSGKPPQWTTDSAVCVYLPALVEGEGAPSTAAMAGPAPRTGDAR